MKFKPDYTSGDVLALYEMRKNDMDEGRIRALATQLRAMCRLEHKVNIPKQYQAITREARTPYIRDAWHRITSSLIAKYPIVHAQPLNEKREDYREAASIAERADLAMIERFNKELGRDLIFNLTSQEVRDGESVLKVVHRQNAWANFPLGVSKDDQDGYKKSAPFPIAWRDIDRLSVVFENGEYGDEWVIEYGEYAKPYLRNRYSMVEDGRVLVDPARSLEGRPMPEGLLSTSTGRSVKVEFFTDKEWHVIIDGSEAPGFPKQNPYSPHLPYFRAAAYESESLLYSLLYLVPRLDELLTMKLNWAALGAYPNPVLEAVPNQAIMGLDSPLGTSEEGDSAPFEWVPGKLIETPLGKKFGFVSPPPVGRDINELTMIFQGLIEVAGIPSIMRGSSLSGATGYLANQQLAAASMAYRIASISAQRQLEKGLEFSHWLVSNIVKQTVYVMGWDAINTRTGQPTKKAQQTYLGLSPDEESTSIANLTKVGSVEVRYRPILPTDDQARAMIALQLTNSSKPLYGRRQALETWMQEEDPDSILEELRVEDAMDREPLASIILENALRRANLLPKAPPVPNPASALVGPGGGPLLPPGPSQLNPAVPAEQSVLGTPAQPGNTMPIQPTGGRPGGMYPGMPGNQGPGAPV